MERLSNGNEWWLNVNGEFLNSTSESLRSGNVADLPQPGHLFSGKNPYINPFFNRQAIGEPELGS